jgi:hypothetical protein
MNDSESEIVKFLKLPSSPFKATIVCYPRSGSTFLGRYIEQRAKKDIKKSHTFDIIPGYKIVGTFRNPTDSISSFVAMAKHYVKKIDYEKMIDEQIIAYNQMMEFLISNADIMVNYERLIKEPESVVAEVCKALNIGILYNFTYVDQIENILQDNFLKTSKNLDLYKKIMSAVNESNLKVSFELYNLALSLDKTI